MHLWFADSLDSHLMVNSNDCAQMGYTVKHKSSTRFNTLESINKYLGGCISVCAVQSSTELVVRLHQCITMHADRSTQTTYI